MADTAITAPAFRRQCLRLERGLIDPEEFQAYLARAWQPVDDELTDELTDEQWRQIGRCNGRVCQ